MCTYIKTSRLIFKLNRKHQIHINHERQMFIKFKIATKVAEIPLSTNHK